MKAYLGFLMIPAAVAAGFAGAYVAPAEPTVVSLPAVQALKVPLSPDAVSPVSRRDPTRVDLRALMPAEPFRIPVVPPRPMPFVVSAILVDGDRRITQIGNEMYQLGDRIQDYRIQRIEPMRVLLVANGGRRIWVEMTKGY